MEDPDRSSRGRRDRGVDEAKKGGQGSLHRLHRPKDPQIHLKMLETAGAHNFKFDTVQMPLNVMDAHIRSFSETGASRCWCSTASACLG